MSCVLRTLGMVLALALALPATGEAPGKAADLIAHAQATTADVQHGRILFLQHCATCHRARAWGDGPREIPALAGQREPYLLEQLARFASGERAGSPMHGAAMRESLQPGDVDRPQSLRDLAAYLARLEPNPRPESGEGRGVEAGARAYARACAACHGVNAAGNDAGPVPRIAGQHFRYLVSRLRDFASVHGGRSDAPSLQAARGISAEEQRSIADYLSRMIDAGAPTSP